MDHPALLLLPDISGFTALVRSTDLQTGGAITFALLSTIIEHNTPAMNIAEIEGDAVFFYDHTTSPDVQELQRRFEKMKAAFDKQVAALEIQYRMPLDLQLKAVAHYGPVTEFSLGGFTKLYGAPVVEAHRLLKNNVPARSYLLLTDELLAAAGTPHAAAHNPCSARASQLCSIYGDLRNICFTYLLFDTALQAAA